MTLTTLERDKAVCQASFSQSLRCFEMSRLQLSEILIRISYIAILIYTAYHHVARPAYGGPISSVAAQLCWLSSAKGRSNILCT